MTTPYSATTITTDDVTNLCKNARLNVPDEFVEAFRPVLAALDGCAKLTMEREGQRLLRIGGKMTKVDTDYVPKLDKAKYVRKDIDNEVDNGVDGGGWAAKVSLIPEHINKTGI